MVVVMTPLVSVKQWRSWMEAGMSACWFWGLVEEDILVLEFGWNSKYGLRLFYCLGMVE